MITCRELYGFLDDFLDEALDLKTRMAFMAHLALCGSCRRYLKTYQATIGTARGAEAAGALDDCDPPRELVEAILASRSGLGAQ